MMNRNNTSNIFHLPSYILHQQVTRCKTLNNNKNKGKTEKGE